MSSDPSLEEYAMGQTGLLPYKVQVILHETRLLRKVVFFNLPLEEIVNMIPRQKLAHGTDEWKKATLVPDVEIGRAARRSIISIRTREETDTCLMCSKEGDGGTPRPLRVTPQAGFRYSVVKTSFVRA